MNVLKKISIVLLVLSFIIFAFESGYAQPKTQKKEIPKDIPDAVKGQIELLSSSDPIQRARAAFYLGRMGSLSDPAIPLLIEMLDDKADLQWSSGSFDREGTSPAAEAAEALGRIGDSAVEPIIPVLKNEDMWVRTYASEVLLKIGDTRAVEPLIAALKDDYWKITVNAAEALGNIGDPRAVEPLISEMKEGHWKLREKAVEALGNIGDTRAVEPLIAALKNKDEDIRQNAAEALGKIGDPRAVEPLIAVSKDENQFVRASAAAALKKIKRKEIKKKEIKRKGVRKQVWWWGGGILLVVVFLKAIFCFRA